MAAHEPGCELCDFELAAGPPGGWIHQDDLWSVGVLPGYEAPGWVAGQLRRHAVGLAALSAEELRQLGPLLARLSAAISEATGSEKVYLVAFGERYPHWHFLLTPAAADLDPAHRGPNLVPAKDDYLDLDRAAEVADRLRSLLAP